MTDQPPGGFPPQRPLPQPPAGGYPPPPPPSGGPVPPPPGPAIRALPSESYTPWITRVLAVLIDWAPVVILNAIAWATDMLTEQQSCVSNVNEYDVVRFCDVQNSVIGFVAEWVALVLILAYLIWNYGYRQGVTGSSVGKSFCKFKVVSEATGAPLGFGASLVRQLAHLVDAIICYIGFLWPLWDAKRQTLADKMMSTVCLPA